MSDVLAINIDATAFLVQSLEHIVQWSGEQLRRNNILSDSPLHHNSPWHLALKLTGHCGVFIQVIQHLDVPVGTWHLWSDCRYYSNFKNARQRVRLYLLLDFFLTCRNACMWSTVLKPFRSLAISGGWHAPNVPTRETICDDSRKQLIPKHGS